MKVGTFALALAGAAIAVPAMAAEPQGNQAAVRYNDLDLTSADGRKELDRRLDRAAREVCGTEKRTVGSRIAPREARECYREARGQMARHFAAIVERGARGG